MYTRHAATGGAPATSTPQTPLESSVPGCHPKKGGTDVILLDGRADGLYERIGIVRLKFLVVFNYGYGGRRRSDMQICGDWKFKKVVAEVED
jgi:hypothetical protein